MSIKKIFLFDSPLLREKAKRVNKFDKDIYTLVQNLKDTLQSVDGLGLSANQIGKFYRVIVIRKNDSLIELINPVILQRKGRVCAMEKCLSLPDEEYKVYRTQQIKVIAKNLNNKTITFWAKNLLARIIQHEIDHLDGILISDYRKE